MNSKAMYIDTCILLMTDEKLKLLTLTEKEKQRGESLSMARALHIIFVLCELKWHYTLSHFIEHLLCIRRESKPTYTSCAKKKRKKLNGAHKVEQGTRYI
jgi:hypothetical protein